MLPWRRTPTTAAGRLLLAASLVLPGCGGGCGGARVVTVPSTTPRQLAEPVQAYVYVTTQDGHRIRSGNRTQLYEGEWVLSDPGGK